MVISTIISLALIVGTVMLIASAVQYFKKKVRNLAGWLSSLSQFLRLVIVADAIGIIISVYNELVIN